MSRGERRRRAFLEAQRGMLDRYGVEAHSRVFEVPATGGRAHALVAGEGPPVVMISGIGTPAAMWAPLMAELKGFRLLGVDLPGYGLTDPTPGFADDLRRNAARFLADALDGLELERPSFVANSLGSLWTMWLALERPERVGALVHVGCPALVLGTSAPVPMRLLAVRPLGRILTRLQPPSPKQVEQLARTVNEYPLVPELVDLLVATERLPGFRPTFLAQLNVLLRLRGSRPEPTLDAEDLERIDHPTLICWGRDDPFGSPRVGERMAEALPDAELHVFGGGHAPWLTQASRIGPVATRFLRRHG